MCDNWAAWVQAIGSVLAIFAAIGVAIWQSHHSRKLLREQLDHDREEERLRRVSALRSIVDAAEKVSVITITACNEITTVENKVRMAKKQATAVYAAVIWLDKLVINELPGSLVAVDVIEIKLQAERLHEILSNVVVTKDLTEEDKIAVTQIRRITKQFKGSITKTADDYKGDTDFIRLPDL